MLVASLITNHLLKGIDMDGFARFCGGFIGGLAVYTATPLIRSLVRSFKRRRGG